MFKQSPDIEEQLRRAMTSRCATAAQAMAEDAKARCPVETGRLRDAIGFQVDPNGEGFAVGVEAGNARDDASGAWYGHMVEGGTRHQAPQPFLRPALDGGKRATIKALEGH